MHAQRWQADRQGPSRGPSQRKINALMVMGVLFALAGIVGLVHPQWQGRDHQVQVEVAGREVLVNTRRVIDIPPLFSGAIMVMGACVVMLGIIAQAKEKYPQK